MYDDQDQESFELEEHHVLVPTSAFAREEGGDHADPDLHDPAEDGDGGDRVAVALEAVARGMQRALRRRTAADLLYSADVEVLQRGDAVVMYADLPAGSLVVLEGLSLHLRGAGGQTATVNLPCRPDDLALHNDNLYVQVPRRSAA